MGDFGRGQDTRKEVTLIDDHADRRVHVEAICGAPTQHDSIARTTGPA